MALATPSVARLPGRHSGRTAVITGGSRGLGRAYAERLAAEGARVVIADLDGGSESQAHIREQGGEAWGVVCDVSDPGSVEALAGRVGELGGADILVHNAGIYPMQPLAGMTFAEWRRVMAINLDSLFLLTQAVAPRMRQQGWGRIVGVASATFHQGTPGMSHYVASKGGVIGFIRAIAAELGRDGVTANAVAPGFIRTEGTSTGAHDAAGLFDKTLAAQAIKHTGTPSDLVGAVSFLASDDAAFITGQTLLVDGGIARA
jgi:NAD(P)-dependent dehydrogenase (short-subunit alcohol dehydrogenase family)